MRYLDEAHLQDIATGAAVLGTGGGGNPYIGYLIGREAVRANGPIKLLTIEELRAEYGDEGLVVPTAMMGAPTVHIEKLPGHLDYSAGFRALEQHFGQPIVAIMPVEIGGSNSMIPLAAAAQMGLPVVDADAMGRAFPEIQMATFTMHDIAATPMFVGDEKGNYAILHTIDNLWTERFARALTVQMGARALTADFVVTAKQVQETAILGTITLAETIGRTIREAQAANDDVVAAVRAVTGALELFQGKIVDVVRQTTDGFARGAVTLVNEAQEQLTIDFQNEFLLARRDGQPVAITPDLITMLDADSGAPITTEALRYGLRTAVLGLPCDPCWRTPAGLALVGPAYFGYDTPYVAIEELSTVG
ncbi:MAG: DUF917 domain-containing protein [Chloroflexota bacterium]